MAKSAKKKVSKKHKKTIVTFILDRSGSMQSIQDDVIGGFNQYLDTLQSGKEEIRFNLVQFDTQSIDKLYVDTAIKQVPKLTDKTFVPRGGTPLIDAVYASIKATEEQVGKKKVNVAITIFTDGLENASHLHTNDELKALIEEKQAQGWAFLYMGSEINAYEDAAKWGISRGQTVSADSKSTRELYRAAASNTMSYAASGVASSANFSDLQKMSLGDKYDASWGAQPSNSSSNQKQYTHNKRVGTGSDFSFTSNN